MAEARTIGIDEARRAVAAGEVQVIDVRDDAAWRVAHIPGAVHVPGGEDIARRIAELEGEGPLLIACERGERSAELARELDAGEREVLTLDGGMDAWVRDDKPMQPSPDPDL